jgi:hypothetical protein
LLYRFHPWSGLPIAIHKAIDKPDGVVFRCDIVDSDSDRWLENPAWMFDRSACAKVRLVATDPHADMSALVALASLLRDVLHDPSVVSNIPDSVVSNLSRDPNRGDVHVMSKQAGARALMPNAHEGCVSWEKFEAIRKMVSSNIPTSRHHGAPKHGDALLAGLLRCHRCGRKLTLRYSGAKHHLPRYSCSRGWLDNGEPRCIAFGGLWVDEAIENALLAVVGPGAIAAATAAEKEAKEGRDQVREALVRDLEAARYAADRAFRQYDATDPANRLVVGELEARWNKALVHVAEVEGKIAAHDAEKAVPAVEPASLMTLATDLNDCPDHRRAAEKAYRSHIDP